MKSLTELRKKAMPILDECKIPYEDVPLQTNPRLRKAWGRCVIEHRVYGERKYIQLSSMVLNDKTPEDITMNTLLHEYIHTCKGCANHGDMFQKYCKKIMQKYPKYKLGTYVDKQESEALENLGITNSKKYHLKCEKCGAEWYRATRTKLVQHPERYKCGCGGTIHNCED